MNDERTPQTLNGSQQAVEVFPLDDAAIEMLSELDQQERSVTVARNTLLSYFARQHKLQGQWQLSENRRELVKREP